MVLQHEGALIVLKDAEKISEKFTKREFVIEDSSQYPQKVSFQLTQDKCDLLDVFKLGDSVKVNFNLRGRDWKSPQGEIRYFNTLEAWKIELIPSSEQFAPIAKTTIIEDLEEDQLPF